MKFFSKYLFFCLVLFALDLNLFSRVRAVSVPGWNGQALINCDSLSGWSVENDAGSSGTLELDSGFIDSAVRLNWDIGTGDWVQAKYTFPEPIDLSSQDIFGISLHGDTLSTSNRISIMFADTNNVFYGLNFDYINIIGRWMKNLPIPRKMFYYFFTIHPGSGEEINWSKIDRFFVAVKRPEPSSGGGNGKLLIDYLQSDRAADWQRQSDFETVFVADSSPADSAVSYVMNQQKTTGLFLSWKEEPDPKAWLYDQALVLILLTREGEWEDNLPVNDAAEKADSLVKSVNSDQYTDGHWPRCWNPETGDILVDDRWAGDQAWWTMALMQYYKKSEDTAARDAALNGANWIIDSCGVIVPGTEGSVDIWWALMSTGNSTEADSVKEYLLSTVWDDSLKYWWRGYDDPFVAIDAATWVGEFARTNNVDRPGMAKAALSFVHQTLITTDDSGTLYGFDGMGPVSIWCEGAAQYVASGGEDAQYFLDSTLLPLQRADGGMPGSTDNWGGTCFGWLSTWTGLAPTCWLYFAITGSPFDTTVVYAGILEKDFKETNNNFLVLRENRSNPFSNKTEISYEINIPCRVTMKIYNLLGQEIKELKNGKCSRGIYTTIWNGTDNSGNKAVPGIYFLNIRAGKDKATKKLVKIN
jgi:hypothetical protein